MTNTFRERVTAALKNSLPKSVRQTYRRYRQSLVHDRYRNMAPRDVFTEIYTKGLWGKGSDDPFYSGWGSHDVDIVGPYIEASAKFLQRFGKPDVVDLGCGDFSIGSQLRKFCGNYVAGDIVEPLIERNRQKFSGIGVQFRVVDLATDELPAGDVLFIRQVLQHMSNADIARAVAKIQTAYKYLVLTEHLPAGHDFTHNLDKPAGPDVRLNVRVPSGVVLTSPPFNLQVKSSQLLCEVDKFDGVGLGVVKTIAYQLK